ncbi:A24 family peptidase [Paractinoplanes ferrugineus]|uniref:Prepilin peptidase n=1 Tax=Paractinoplanes ferrugineus TaxID=113564 RepID=A0A919J2Q2_9ACTN|nr:prepilin peptidase [Actinoplanes ferrugineus]
MAVVFGAASAAFLPRLAHRLAVGFADPPRAGCADCLRPFGAGLPSWVRVGAACSCSDAYGRPVIAGGMVAGVLAATLGPVPELPAYLLAAVPGLLLAMIDLRCLRLPDPLVGALAVTAAGPLAVLRPGQIGVSLVAAVAVLIAYTILFLLGGLGLGDVKLAAVLALILGFAGAPALIVGLLAPHLIGGSAALFRLVSGRRGPFAFGPALLLGALAGLALQQS